MKANQHIEAGKYLEMNMLLTFDAFSKKFSLTVKKQLSHTVDIGADAYGNITRINNLLTFYNDFEAHYIEKYNTIENNNVSDDAQRMMILNELLKFKNRMMPCSDDEEVFEIIYRDNQLCALVKLVYAH